MTSTAAPAMRFSRRHSSSASSSTTPPRARFTRSADFFMSASSLPPTRWRVSLLSGQCSVTKSASLHSSSSPTQRPPSAATCEAGMYGSHTTSDIDAHAGARDDLQPSAAFLDVPARDAALAADDRVDLRRFALPALGLGPRIDVDDFGARAQPLDELGIEFLDEDAAERHAPILESPA